MIDDDTASGMYNTLPFRARLITSVILNQHHLRDLRIEEQRAKKAHKRHMEEVAAHRRNIEAELEKGRKALAEAEGLTAGA